MGWKLGDMRRERKNNLGKIPGNVRPRKGMGHIPKSSVVVVSQVAAGDKERLLEKIGTLDHKSTEEILRSCGMVISSSIF